MKKKLLLLTLAYAGIAFSYVDYTDYRTIIIQNNTDIELKLFRYAVDIDQKIEITLKPYFRGQITLWTPAKFRIQATNKDFNIEGTQHYITGQRHIAIDIRPNEKIGKLQLYTTEILPQA